LPKKICGALPIWGAEARTKAAMGMVARRTYRFEADYGAGSDTGALLSGACVTLRDAADVRGLRAPAGNLIVSIGCRRTSGFGTRVRAHGFLRRLRQERGWKKAKGSTSREALAAPSRQSMGD